ncbi:hypothetical protein [Kitasatospora sp. NPDC101183]|uniref:hypothetical protein n=1 Tax=Kitasatospora sp. NPDC101183 TaxID=3364100 RepID=UPI0038185AD5
MTTNTATKAVCAAAGALTGVIAAAAAFRRACAPSAPSVPSAPSAPAASPARSGGIAGGIGCTPGDCPPPPGRGGPGDS